MRARRWLIVGLFCIIVSLALGEIASTYPTAGGLYYSASKLGSPAWGWFTGWFNLVGRIAVTAAIGYGCAVFMTSLLNLLWDYPNSLGWILFTCRSSCGSGRESSSSAARGISGVIWFKGPIRPGTEEELERIEAEYGAPTVAPGPAPAA